MATYLNNLIKKVRKRTENEEFSDTTGISNDEFVGYANDAQERLQSLISGKHNKVFTKEARISTVADQAAYALPSDIYLDNRVSLVEYTPTNNDKDLWVVKKARLSERINVTSSHPTNYIISGGKIILSPVPRIGRTDALRISYVERKPKLDIRRGKIFAVTNDATNSPTIEITKIQLFIDETLDQDAVEAGETFSIINPDGSRHANAFNGRYTSTSIVNIAGTDYLELAVTGLFYDLSDVLFAAGNFITLEPNSITHTELPDMCERYILKFMEAKVLGRDSHIQQGAIEQELRDMEGDIVESFADLSDDVDYVANINDDLYGDDWW